MQKNFTDNSKQMMVNYWYLLRNPDAELWTKVTGCKYYMISSKGQVKSCKGKDKFLRIHKNISGYNMVKLVTNDMGKKTKTIHRLVALHFIPNPEHKPLVDHISGNRTDNSISNLRWATVSQNQQNRKKKHNGTSKYKGVCWNKNNQMWYAGIRINERQKHLGFYHCEEDAATAYDHAAKLYFESFARLNHIDELKRARMKKYRQKLKKSKATVQP